MDTKPSIIITADPPGPEIARLADTVEEVAVAEYAKYSTHAMPNPSRLCVRKAAFEVVARAAGFDPVRILFPGANVLDIADAPTSQTLSGNPAPANDGMLPAERIALAKLGEAWDAYVGAYPGGDDRDDFRHHMNAMQRILATRAMGRLVPRVWAKPE